MKTESDVNPYRFIHPHPRLAPSPRFILSARQARKDYRVGANVVSALKGVDLEVTPGTFLAISGPSGSGKSTLLNLFGCLESPTGGEVLVCGHPASDLSRRERTRLRLHSIGFVFQNFNLFPVLTALENVEFPLDLLGVPARSRRARALEALERVGLSAHRDHRPNELSGGQKQRIAIARAIVAEPRVVLADEPTANLDRKTGIEIIELMRSMNRSSGTTFVFSTHDPLIMERASRTVVLADGLIASERGAVPSNPEAL